METTSKDSQSTVFTRGYVVCGLALICTFLWGSAFPCIKTGYKLFAIESSDTASQMLFAGYRFTLAGVLTLLIGWVGNRRFPIPKREIWKNIPVLGLLQTTFQYLFFYIGLSHTAGAKGSIIAASNYFLAIVLAHFIFTKKRGYSGDDRMTLKKAGGCLLGLAGIVLVNFTSNGFGGGFALNGEGLMLCSSLTAAFASVYLKSFTAKDNPFTITGWQFLFGGIILAAVGYFRGGEVHGFTIQSSALLFYMAVISSVAFSLWALLLKYNPVGRVSIYGFTNPIFGVILSGLILGEEAFTLKNFMALICVCAGIMLVNLRTSGKKKVIH
ncbi:MAG: DMT family transporter [Clostridia bacterium]|nr:DMT family transporter [Clostridia bacterium]NCC43174.1 DMT family transporter [Clostridia bacterium]